MIAQNDPNGARSKRGAAHIQTHDGRAYRVEVGDDLFDYLMSAVPDSRAPDTEVEWLGRRVLVPWSWITCWRQQISAEIDDQKQQVEELEATSLWDLEQAARARLVELKLRGTLIRL